MKLEEFEKDAVESFITKHDLNEQQIDEILPAIGAIAKGAGTLAAKGAGALAKGVAKGVGAVAKGAAQGVAKGVGAAAKGAVKSVASAATDKIAQAAQKSQQDMQQDLIKKGNKIPFPTKSGQAKEFEIDDVQGDEVTIINPDAAQKPDEPEKLVYKKDDINAVVGSLTQGQQ